MIAFENAASEIDRRGEKGGASRALALDRLHGILGSIADARVMLVVSRATSYIKWPPPIIENATDIKSARHRLSKRELQPRSKTSPDHKKLV